jgi:hypothetical protein
LLGAVPGVYLAGDDPIPSLSDEPGRLVGDAVSDRFRNLPD